MKRKVITNMKKNEIIELFDRLISDIIDIYSVAAVLSCSTVYAKINNNQK